MFSVLKINNFTNKRTNKNKQTNKQIIIMVTTFANSRQCWQCFLYLKWRQLLVEIFFNRLISLSSHYIWCELSSFLMTSFSPLPTVPTLFYNYTIKETYKETVIWIEFIELLFQLFITKVSIIFYGCNI